jgi:hypothetical protein
MRLIGFDDSCVIKRNLGVNGYDEPILEEIYVGVCCYQEGGYSNAQRMFMRNPILFLPDVSVLVNANDIVEKLKVLDVNTLTPIEAMSVLYDFVKQANNN